MRFTLTLFIAHYLSVIHETSRGTVFSQYYLEIGASLKKGNIRKNENLTRRSEVCFRIAQRGLVHFLCSKLQKEAEERVGGVLKLYNAASCAQICPGGPQRVVLGVIVKSYSIINI